MIYVKIYTLNDMERTEKDSGDLLKLVHKYVDEHNLFAASEVINQFLEKEPENLEALYIGERVSFMLGNYVESLMRSDYILQLKPRDVYGMKGKGIALYCLGDIENGILFLKEAARHATSDYMEPYHLLLSVLRENNKIEEFLTYADEAENKSPGFKHHCHLL